MIVFAFAKVEGTQMSWFTNASKNLTLNDLVKAKAAKMGALISVGGEGQYNTFKPTPNATEGQLQTLATNIVNFVKTNGFDGIDFDIETKYDPKQLQALLQYIRADDPTIIITGAPQIYQGKLISACTWSPQDCVNSYELAAKTPNLFNYLFVQEYNAGQTDPSFISTSFPVIKGQIDPSVKIVVGEPTDAVGANASGTIYHPNATTTLTTSQVTTLMLPELKQIQSDPQFSGIMGWSLNTDYDQGAYAPTVSHIPGQYAYALQNCVHNGDCAAPPPPKFDNKLQVTNTDTANGIGFTALFYLGTPTVATTYLGPATGSVTYSPDSPQAAALQKQSRVTITVTPSFGAKQSCSVPISFVGNSKNGLGIKNNMVHVMLSLGNQKGDKLNCSFDYYASGPVKTDQYGLQVSNVGAAGSSLGFNQVGINAPAFSSGYIAPAKETTFLPSSTAALVNMEGKTNISVYWSSYAGGPVIKACTGVPFNFTKYSHLMVNPTTQACDLAQ